MKTTKAVLGILTLVLGLAVQVPAQSSLSDGLVAYYPLTVDGKDQSGHGLDLTLSNVVFTTVGSLASDLRPAASFDGVSSYGVINQALIDGQANWSWSAWLYSPQAGPVNPSVQSMYMEGAQGGNCFAIDLGEGLLDIAAFNISFPGNWLGTEVPNVLTNGWNHLAFTLAGGGVGRGTLSIYFNGVLTGSALFQTVSPGNPLPQRGTVGNGWAAGNPSFPTAPWKGSMADLRFYNRALSSAEVQQLYALAAGAPAIAVEPQSQTVSIGGTATLSVEAGGAPPLSYQWQLNGVDLPGATGSSLVLPNVQLAQAGVYWVIVSNAEGAVTSSSATLTVSPQSGCAPVPAGLVGWWAGEGNANDSTGVDNGVLEGGVTFVPGEVGQAFSFDGTTADVHIPASATLNVGAGGGMSVEAWIKPADVTAQHPLVEWNGGSFGAELWVGVIPPLGTGPGCLYGSFIDAARQPNAISSAGQLVVANVWQHVATTYDKATGIAVLYLNGAVVQQETLGVFTPLTTGDLWLGLRPYDADAGLRYAGEMDEVSVYNRALSATEVLSIFAAGTAGKCAGQVVQTPPYIVSQPSSQTVAVGGTATFSVGAEGTPPLSYQWERNGTYISGAAGSSLVLPNVQLAEAGGYSVIVSNAEGAVTSSSATLTVSAQPPGNALVFAAGTSSGAPFSQVLVPIDVNLFSNILTFQFSLHWDPTVATYVDVEQFGLPGLGAGSFGTALSSSGTLTVSWDDPSGSGESLSDGATLFAIRFELVGSPGAASAVTMDGAPTTLQVASSDLTLVPVQTAPGQLSVALAPTAVIGGQVWYYPTNYPPSGPSDQAVAGVTVNLTGATNLDEVTGTDGSYSFPGLAAGLGYEISPAKSDDEPPANGVSTLGIALIRRQILDLAPLDSPYALLAADVNASGTVDTLDIALIRRLILALTNTFPAGLWRFVPADYAFPDPLNPWEAPSFRGYPNLQADMAGQDYVAIKLGDVNHSWVSPGGGPKVRLPGGTEPGLKATRELSPVRFEARGQMAQPGERVAVRVGVGGFAGGTSAQFTLGWDARVLRYAGVGGFGVRGLGEDNFGAALAGSGRLTFSWDDPAGTGLEAADGGQLFTVYFDVIGPGGSVSPVAFGDSPTVREASVDLVPRAFAGWAGRVIVVGRRPGPAYRD